MPYRRRQLVAAALTANALRPLGGRYASIPAFFAGWLTSELAPQLLAATLVDTTAELTVRRSRIGHTSRSGLALAAVTAGGLGYLILSANRSATHVESTLRDGLGEDYLDALEAPPTADLKTRVREVARPFKMAKPDVEVIHDINYVEGGRRARLDIYRAKDVDLENAPVLVQVHGGGWTVGNKEHQGLLLMNRMAQRGWVCVAMNYRLAPKASVPRPDHRREAGDRLDAGEHRRLRRGPVVPRGHRRQRWRAPGRAGGAHPRRAGVPAGLRARRHQCRGVRPVLRRLRHGRHHRRQERHRAA